MVCFRYIIVNTLHESDNKDVITRIMLILILILDTNNNAEFVSKSH